jgi:hypothetical protein
MTKAELQILLNQVNATDSSTAENIKAYISLVKFSVEKLQALQQEEKNPMLDAWLTMGIEEIRKDLSGRLTNGFENLSPEKRKTEFMYSKSTITMALTNILMNL